jgi:hypothetical protein
MTMLIQFLGLVPALIDAIMAVERAIPAGGTGAGKLEIIKATVEAVNEQQKNLPMDKLLPLVESFAALFVAALNKLGIFRHAK